MMAANKDFVIEQGETFALTVRWETDTPEVYKAITAISKTGPVRITAPGHGLVDGWRAAIEGVKGMVEINASHSPPRCNEYHEITYVDANTIDINTINTAAVDENGDDLFGTYISGGYLRNNSAVDMTGYTPEMIVRDRVGGNIIASTRVADAPLNIITATADNTTKTINILISVDDVDALTWTRGVYDLSMVSTTSTTKLAEGTITVSKD
jgi:hypothetical protein